MRADPATKGLDSKNVSKSLANFTRVAGSRVFVIEL
jgi:hypothetical protein